MAFQFRFDSILALRCRERDEAGREVGKANEAIRRVDEQIRDLQRQRDEIRRLAAGMFQNHGDGNRESPNSHGVSIDRALQQGRYDLQLQAEQIGLRSTKETLLKELQRRRDVLVNAEAEVKRLERLRETQKSEYRYLELQREQAESDDLTTARLIIDRRNRNRSRT
ncbi:flagellar export protein FliJ [Neorhodopirellula pilleata]|uniref:Flagellar FliJ protein n=1 Tax=Neorhodopirellula pilleata TaxID=2714738 RepID=A0A5C6ASX1_9BACT|nr:flagellar export protein FliJ [Neorhodopirellula pilleata]TWU02092.1 flagellar biosynthesis chaperone [Neorhodopirellula pilleata]